MARPIMSFLPVVPAQPTPGPPKSAASAAKKAAKGASTPAATPAAAKKAAKKTPTPASSTPATTPATTPAAAKKAAKKVPAPVAGTSTPAATPAKRAAKKTAKTPSQVLNEVREDMTSPMPGQATGQKSLFGADPAPAPAPAARKPRAAKKTSASADMTSPLNPAAAPLPGQQSLFSDPLPSNPAGPLLPQSPPPDYGQQLRSALGLDELQRKIEPPPAAQPMLPAVIPPMTTTGSYPGVFTTPRQTAQRSNPLDQFAQPTKAPPMLPAVIPPMTTTGAFPRVEVFPPRSTGASPPSNYNQPTPPAAQPMLPAVIPPRTTAGAYPGVLVTPRQTTSTQNPLDQFAQAPRAQFGAVATIPRNPVASGIEAPPVPLSTPPRTTAGRYPGVFVTPERGALSTIPPKSAAPSRLPTVSPPTRVYRNQLRDALGSDEFQRRADTAAVVAGLAALGGVAGYGLGVSGNNSGMQSPVETEQDRQTRELIRLNQGLQSGGPPPVVPALQAPSGSVTAPSPFKPPLQAAGTRAYDEYTPRSLPQNRSPLSLAKSLGSPIAGIGNAVQTGWNLAPNAIRDAQLGYWGDSSTSAIDAAVQQSQMDNPLTPRGGYDSAQAMQSIDQNSDAFTQGLNVLRQRGFRDNPNRAAALLADAQGYNPNVLRSAAQSLGGYDTRWSPGGEFNPNQSPLSEAEMAGIRNTEQYRQGSMMTPGGLVSRFGRGGPMGLQALAAQQSERDAEQDFRMRSRMAADQRLLDMSNPMTQEGLANIMEGQMPASPTDPFQRRSSTFAYLNPANAGANNPRGVTGTNRLGMLRMMQAQGQIPEGSDLASELSSEEAIARRNSEARRSPKYQEAVRETLQNRAAQKRAASEDRALSRYLKQGYSPTDPFLQQRFPGAVQRWADNLGIGQRQAYGFGGAGPDQGSSMESPLSTFVQGTAPTAAQLADSSNLLAHVTAPDGEFTSIDSPGFGVFAAYRQGQPGAFTSPSTIDEKLQASLSGDPDSVSLNVDNLKALQMYARAAAASPELKGYISNERTPGLVSLLNANFDAQNGLQSFYDDNRNRKQTVRKAKQSELSTEWYSQPVSY